MIPSNEKEKDDMSTLKNIMLLVLILMLTVTSLQAQEKPNVVVIIVSYLGYAYMSFLPQAPADVKRYKTPDLTGLPPQGPTENAYATSPICSPSRAGILTGSYQQLSGAITGMVMVIYRIIK